MPFRPCGVFPSVRVGYFSFSKGKDRREEVVPSRSFRSRTCSRSMVLFTTSAFRGSSTLLLVWKKQGGSGTKVRCLPRWQRSPTLNGPKESTIHDQESRLRKVRFRLGRSTLSPLIETAARNFGYNVCRRDETT